MQSFGKRWGVLLMGAGLGALLLVLAMSVPPTVFPGRSSKTDRTSVRVSRSPARGAEEVRLKGETGLLAFDRALKGGQVRTAELDAARAQVIAGEWVQRAAGELFNALGASDTRTGKALDRHWRNARTLSSHNPVIYKARNIGDWEINRNTPTFIWQIGSGG